MFLQNQPIFATRNMKRALAFCFVLIWFAKTKDVDGAFNDYTHTVFATCRKNLRYTHVEFLILLLLLTADPSIHEPLVPMLPTEFVDRARVCQWLNTIYV